MNTVIAGEQRRLADLAGFAGENLQRLPWVLRILLENALRHDAGDLATARPILAWLDNGTSSAEIPFYPARLLMHDTTCVPALVDIAAMRSELAEAGHDPTRLNPQLPIDVSVDHSIAVDYFGTPNALERNMTQEIQRNEERYRLLKWATHALRGVRVHPPGTGIMHTMNLELLATVVTAQPAAAGSWVYPDTLIGTDSHTPMINGIGVLAGRRRGRGRECDVRYAGDVESAGSRRCPDDRCPTRRHARYRSCADGDGTTAHTAIVRKIRGIFRTRRVSPVVRGARGHCQHGTRIRRLMRILSRRSAHLEYLRATGRPESHIALVEAYCKHQHLWFDPQAEPRYTEVIDIDLNEIETSIAGPHRPQERLTPGRTVAWLAGASRPGRAPTDSAGVRPMARSPSLRSPVAPTRPTRAS